MCITRNHVVKIINPLISHGGVTFTDTMCQMFFFFNATILLTMYIILRVVLPRHSWGLYGDLVFGFPSGADVFRPNILWSTPPHPKIHQVQVTSMASPSMPKIICVWQACDGLNRVSSRCISPKMVYRHDMMCRQMHKATNILRALGRMLFCHNAKFWYLHGSWFLIFLEPHLNAAGTSASACSPSSMESWLVDPVSPGLTSLHSFDSDLGMPSSQLLVSWLTGNASSTCGTMVGLLLHLPDSIFTFFCSKLWQMGNRKCQCRVQLCPSLSMGCTTYTCKCG